MIYILPTITLISFIVSVVLVLKNIKDKLISLYIFTLTTGLVFSIVEAYVMFKFNVSLSGTNLILFIVMIILDSLNCLLKAKSFIKSFKNNTTSKSFLVYDQMCIFSMILLIIVIR